jgi:glucose/mannose-6-phosphate isomerase
MGPSLISKSPLFDLAFNLPDHLQRGIDLASDLRGLPQSSEIDNILILGMGAGRTAGNIIRTLGSTTIPVPIVVESSYEIPACVGPRSLVFAISGSGNTNEVNHCAAASAQRDAQLVIITAEGWLVDLAEDYRAPIIQIPTAIKPARVTLGLAVAAILMTLHKMCFLPEVLSWIESADAQLKQRREELIGEGNFAARLASMLVGRHVLCQGDSPLGATAAERWKAQINQNAKQPASSSDQPNACHNEAVGWDSLTRCAGECEAAVLLRHPYEDSRVSQCMNLLSAYLEGKVPVHSVHGKGATPLAALMDLIIIGDFMSLYLAEKNGVDPSEVRFISDTVKRGLVAPERRTR